MPVLGALVPGCVPASCPGHSPALRQSSGSTALNMERRAETAKNKMLPCWTCTLISDNRRAILQGFVSHHLLCFSEVKITWALHNLIISAVASKKKKRCEYHSISTMAASSLLFHIHFYLPAPFSGRKAFGRNRLHASPESAAFWMLYMVSCSCSKTQPKQDVDRARARMELRSCWISQGCLWVIPIFRIVSLQQSWCPETTP